jgi:hypothetical protein
VLKPEGGRRGLFLVKGSFDSDNCTQLDLENPLPQLEHEIVGELMGVDLDTLVTHGNVMAVSPSRRRVAVATWDRIQLFAIEPEAFLDARKGSLSLERRRAKKIKRQSFQFVNLSCEFSDEEDHTYSTNCGQGYYHQYTRFWHRRIVALAPSSLPANGVIHKLHFIDDETLWGWTDQGLSRWYWGPGRLGRRVEKELFPGTTAFGARSTCVISPFHCGVAGGPCSC